MRTEWNVRRENLLEEMFSSKYFLEPARVPEQGACPVLFLPMLCAVSFQATPLGPNIFHPLGIREPRTGHNGVVVRNQIKGVETGETMQGSMDVLSVRVPSRSLITTRTLSLFPLQCPCF